jgi:acyl-coenzyme A thioesterase PaaI-like protein
MEKWPKIDLNPMPEYTMCFGCGKSNPIGLKLKFNWDEKTRTAAAEFNPTENLQGWPGHLHGGITSCVLDEAMGWAAMLAGFNNVTAKMEIRFRQMVPLNGSYIVSCTVTKQTRSLIETAAKLTDKNGTVYAEGTSIQFIASPRNGEHPQQEDKRG